MAKNQVGDSILVFKMLLPVRTVTSYQTLNFEAGLRHRFADSLPDIDEIYFQSIRMGEGGGRTHSEVGTSARFHVWVE